MIFMKEIIVEGFRVLIEKGEHSGFVLSVPELPGVVGQVEKEEEAPKEMQRLIRAHLVELTGKLPKPRRGAEDQPAKRTEARKKGLN